MKRIFNSTFKHPTKIFGYFYSKQTEIRKTNNEVTRLDTPLVGIEVNPRLEQSTTTLAIPLIHDEWHEHFFGQGAAKLVMQIFNTKTTKI